MSMPHLCHVFPAFSTGGPEVRTAQLINATADRFRHSIIALNGDSSGSSRLSEPDAVSCQPGPVQRGFLRYLKDLGQLIASGRPDLVLTYGWGGCDAIIASRMAGLRHVVHEEDGFLPDEAVRQKFRRLVVRRLFMPRARLLICPSQTLVRIARRDWWLPESRIRFIPNGIDVERFSPPESSMRERARKQWGLREEETVVGTVGQLRGEKNHARLLRAFARLSPSVPTRLLLVGEGTLRQALERQAVELGIADRVVFVGLRTDPLPCYHAMDVFALTSDTEQMPLALLEAMAVGLPAVSTRVGDVFDMVSEANQELVVPAGDEEHLPRALSCLVSSRTMQARLGAANRERCVAEFSHPQMVAAYSRMYEQSLPGGLPLVSRTACPGGIA